MKKFNKYMRTCKKCGKVFKSELSSSKVCLNCYGKNKGIINRYETMKKLKIKKERQKAYYARCRKINPTAFRHAEEFTLGWKDVAV